jgi:tetratricopeptide (TPR) repeat protein
MEGRLGGVWDAPRKAAIAAAFRATGLVDADQTWARAEKHLNAYATEWASAMNEGCLATFVRGEQKEAIFDLQTACLDERLDELRALTGVFATAPDASVVRRAVQASVGLPPLDACRTPDRLNAATRLPSEPKARAEIRERQAELARVNALSVAGKFTQSMDLLQQIRARVEATHYGPVRLAWTMGMAKLDRGHDLKAAVLDWDTAIALAEKYHLDLEKAESELGLGQALRDLGRSEEAHRSMRYAGATLERIGGDPGLELVKDAWDGLTYIDDGKSAEGVRILERTIARAAAAHVDDPLNLAAAHSFLGAALVHDPTRFADAVAHERAALSIMEEAFGPTNVRAGDMVSNLAEIEAAVGRLDDALVAGQRAVAIYKTAIASGEVAATNPNFGMELDEVGKILLRLGRAHEAVQVDDQARTIARANESKERIMDADITLADAWRQLRRFDEATHSWEEARTVVEPEKVAPETMGHFLIVGAALALDQGKVEVGLRLAERAVAVAQTGVLYLYETSCAHLVLARALVRSKGDPSRARVSAEKARDGFAMLHDQRRIDGASAVLGELR